MGSPIHQSYTAVHKLKVAAVSAVRSKLKINATPGIRALGTDGELPRQFLNDK